VRADLDVHTYVYTQFVLWLKRVERVVPRDPVITGAPRVPEGEGLRRLDCCSLAMLMRLSYDGSSA
jgi:hypothetical protein